MSVKEINYKSDFKIFESGHTYDAPFVFQYYTRTSEPKYVASFIDGVYHNCYRSDDDLLVVVFDNHGMKTGDLKCLREFYLSDSDFHDGICNLITNEQVFHSDTNGMKVSIRLTSGETDSVDVNVAVPSYYQRGEDLKWSTMTEAERQEMISALASDMGSTLITSEPLSDDFYEEI